MEIPGYFFAFPIANRGGRWEHQPHQFWLPSSLLSSQSAPRAAAPPRVPTSPPAYKPQTSPTCCFAGKTPYSRSPKLATAGIPGRTPCRGAGCERGSGMGSPRQLPLPWRCLPVRLWPMASRPRPPPPALQPISRLPGALIVFIAGGSQRTGCREPGAGTAG